jgi:hypothetical protein
LHGRNLLSGKMVNFAAASQSAYDVMDYADLTQWPAMALTAAAAWLVGSQSRTKRNIGFWTFLLSNVLWAVWGWHARAYALIILQVCLAAINIRGAQKNDPTAAADSRAG